VAAESTIDRELQDLGGLRLQEKEEGTFSQQKITNNSDDDDPPGTLDPAQPTELVGSESNLAIPFPPNPVDTNENAPTQSTDTSQYAMERAKAHGGEDVDGADGGEEVVEAEEDTVIY
jgi:hypothetical protein